MKMSSLCTYFLKSCYILKNQFVPDVEFKSFMERKEKKKKEEEKMHTHLLVTWRRKECFCVVLF